MDTEVPVTRLPMVTLPVKADAVALIWPLAWICIPDPANEGRNAITLLLTRVLV